MPKIWHEKCINFSPHSSFFIHFFDSQAMRKPFFLTIFLLLAAARAVLGYEIAVVTGDPGLPTRVAGQAFSRQLPRILPAVGGKSIEPHSFHEIVIAEDEPEDSSGARIAARQPDLILALGPRALTAARRVADVPIIYLLVFAPEKIIGDRTDIIGINLKIPPKIQLDAMSRLLPGVKRVGLVYDPARSRALLDEARAVRGDLDFVALPATHEKEVINLLHALRDRVDLLWLLPDLTVLTPRTLPSFLRFSFEHHLPLLSFSEKHLKPGAALIVTFDVEAMAEEAAEIAARVLRGEAAAAIGAKNAVRVKTLVNETILRKMNITVRETAP